MNGHAMKQPEMVDTHGLVSVWQALMGWFLTVSAGVLGYLRHTWKREGRIAEQIAGFREEAASFHADAKEFRKDIQLLSEHISAIKGRPVHGPEGS